MTRDIAALFLGIGMAASFSSAQNFPDGPGKDTFLRICSGCHEPVVVTDNKHSQADWEQMVDTMIGLGAQADDAQMTEIVDYLAKNFGTTPAKPKINVNTASAKDLASGLGLTDAEGEALVVYRTKNGNFTGMADFKKVEGVDSAKIATAKDRIVF